MYGWYVYMCTTYQNMTSSNFGPQSDLSLAFIWRGISSSSHLIYAVYDPLDPYQPMFANSYQ
jgi:hypothetical protein